MALRDWIFQNAYVATATTATIATEEQPCVAAVATVAVAEWPESYFDDHIERVAIILANGVPEEWAMGYATLCSMPCPPSVMPRRWEQLVNDGGVFLDRWGKQAAVLGWQALDVFGVHPTMPETIYCCMGLVWLLAGRPVCAITAETARIECGSGVTQTFRRTPTERDTIALWRLA